METSQRTGLIIMIVAAFQFVFFWAMTRRSYLALACADTPEPEAWH